MQPWQRPLDAFEPLDDAFIYRGALNKRPGYTLFGDPDLPGTGRLYYTDFITFGDGGTTYNDNTDASSVVPGSFTATDGTETFSSDTTEPVGTLTGDAGGTGSITWATGAFTLNFNSSVSSTTPIYASYSPFASVPIMGLKQWVNSLNDQVKLVAFDTKRASVYNDVTNQFDPINTVTDYVGSGNSGTGAGPYNFTLGFSNIVPGSFSLTDGVETFTSDTATPIGALTGSLGGSGTITWASGAVSVTFNTTPTTQFTETYTLAGDYFTGTFQNFFNTVNWNAPGEYGGTDHADCMYITNNKDRITLFDGTDLSRPVFPITQAHQISATNDITTCLDLDVYKNRLLVQRPSIVGKTFPEGPTIRYSAVLNPTNLVADVAGNGGAEEAPTSDWIYASEFLRDQIIVFFKNSTWLFRFTGVINQPFRWDKLNVSKSTNCPYASVSYDERATSVGSKGLIACDGVNVQRYDLEVIDFFLNDIDQNFLNQCYSVRFDNNNQTWTLYPSLSSNSGQSDKVLVYNFLENTWAKYNIALSCLGLYNVTSDKTWADFPDTSWEQAEFAWNSYLLQDLAPTLLSGSHDGYVYQMEDGETDYDSTSQSQVPYNCDIKSTVWNPFATTGAMVQFGYIDLYYECNVDVELDVTFYLNNTNLPGPKRTVTLKQSDVANPNQQYNWQRIYINVSTQSLQMQINSSSEGNFKIIGIILWAKTAGRLTPAKTLL